MYVECEWFAQCDQPSIATVEHPTIGDVEICQSHLDWLLVDGPNPPPTKMVPPMVARQLDRLAAQGVKP